MDAPPHSSVKQLESPINVVLREVVSTRGCRLYRFARGLEHSVIIQHVHRSMDTRFNNESTDIKHQEMCFVPAHVLTRLECCQLGLRGGQRCGTPHLCESLQSCCKLAWLGCRTLDLATIQLDMLVQVSKGWRGFRSHCDAEACNLSITIDL